MAGLLVLFRLLVSKGGAEGQRWAAVLAAITALAGFTSPLIERAISLMSRGKDDPAADTSDLADVCRSADQLAQAVRSQWRDEARTRRLHDPWPLPLQWTAAHEELADHHDLVFTNQLAVAATHAVTNRATQAPPSIGPDALSGQLDEALDRYDQLPHKRLVILGPPGSGKSVLAICLTLAILDRRTSGSPVPVLFPAASWNPSQSGLEDWIVEYLIDNYQFGGCLDPRTVARQLLDHGLILPIVDGFDEMPPAIRPRGIRDLNRRLDADRPVVVTCRTEEYREAVETGDVLTRAAAVELRPLPVPTVIRYLTETTPAGTRTRRWAAVFERLRAAPAGPLATALRTPLMVSLARAVYGDNPRNPAELLDPRFRDAASIEDHLLDELIPATYPEHPDSGGKAGPRRHPSDVESWLGYLARHMQRACLSDLAWWQLERAVPRGVIHGLLGLLGGIVIGFASRPLVGVAFAAITTIAGAGPVSRPWTVEGALANRTARRARGRVVTAGSGAKVPVERRVGLMLGRVLGSAVGLAHGLALPHGTRVLTRIADGVTIGLPVGLAAGFFTLSLRTTPGEVRFMSRPGVTAFLRYLTVGCATGVAMGIVGGAVIGSVGFQTGIVAGVVIGLTFGLLDGINVWLDASTDVTLALSPRSTLHAERIAAVARSLTVGTAIAAATALVFDLATPGTHRLVAPVLVYGVGYGLVDRYMGLGSTVWGRYLIAKPGSRSTGTCPGDWRHSSTKRTETGCCAGSAPHISSATSGSRNG